MSRSARRSPWLEQLFGAEVRAAELRGDGDPQQLFPEERTGQERWVARRVSEYSAGRQCAHLALRELGVEPQPLLAQSDRRPRWPEGCAGSITHCRGFAAAAVARTSVLRSLGMDAELAGAVDASLWPRVLGAAERTWVGQLPDAVQPLAATLVFSAKESFYKCQYPITGHWLEFQEARVTVTPAGAAWQDVRLSIESRDLRLEGRGGVREGIVCTAFCWHC